MTSLRPVPVCCHACESRSVRRHCGSGTAPGANCAWMRCTRCHAVSGYRWDPEKGWRRTWYALGKDPSQWQVSGGT